MQRSTSHPLFNDEMFTFEAEELFDILMNCDQESIDLGDFSDRISNNAQETWENTDGTHGDDQVRDVCASEYITYTISNMLVVRRLFPYVKNIKASTQFHQFVENNSWCYFHINEIYKVFCKPCGRFGSCGLCGACGIVRINSKTSNFVPWWLESN